MRINANLLSYDKIKTVFMTVFSARNQPGASESELSLTCASLFSRQSFKNVHAAGWETRLRVAGKASRLQSELAGWPRAG